MKLIVFSGLPGTGKTTISRRLAERLGAAFLRIDTIEQAIRSSASAVGEVGPAGYAVANALAETNLSLGVSVVVDAVNPVEASRQAWRAIAQRTSSDLTEIEIVCSDPREHRRRVEGRASDIPGLKLPTWKSVSELAFEPWLSPHLRIDAANTSVDDLVEDLQAAIANSGLGRA